MTNPIPPCPVYSIEKHGTGFVIYAGRNNEHHGLNLGYIQEPDSRVQQIIDDANLGRALSDKYGIHTIPQLTERLAPDPRVAVLLVRAYELFHSLDPACEYSGVYLRYKLNDLTAGIENTEPNKLIAAQRGEGQ